MLLFYIFKLETSTTQSHNTKKYFYTTDRHKNKEKTIITDITYLRGHAASHYSDRKRMTIKKGWKQE